MSYLYESKYCLWCHARFIPANRQHTFCQKRCRKHFHEAQAVQAAVRKWTTEELQEALREGGVDPE